MLRELNILFAEVVPAVDRQRGLVYQFTGDGLLAVFGVPYPLDCHAKAAVDAARDIASALRKVNDQRCADGRQPWRIGCGVHTGPVVCGNLGVAGRSEFTVIGDTVNLAARLEGLTRELGGEVVVSEAAWEALAEPRPPADGPLEVEIRGRKGRVRVYRLETDTK